MGVINRTRSLSFKQFKTKYNQNLKSASLDWFNIKNYLKYNKLNIEQIRKVIAHRRKIYNCISFELIPILNYDQFLYFIVHEPLESIIKNNINRAGESCFKLDLSIFLENIYNVIELEANYDKYKLDGVESEKMRNELKKENELYRRKAVLETISNYYEPLMKVDLSYNDNWIIEEFSSLLKKRRNDDKISKSWVLKIQNYRLIPLMDLLMWEALTGNAITNKKKASLLFPDNINVTEKQIKDIHKKQALRLLTSEFNLV